MDEVKFYSCEDSGGIITFIDKGENSLKCLGDSIIEIKANSVDASKEKHVPVIEIEGSKIIVKVGSVPHPMVEEHFIEWIAIAVDNKLEFEYLKPGMEPMTEFVRYVQKEKVAYTGENDAVVPNCEASDCNFDYNEIKTKIVVFAYCNIHGLWKAEI